MDEFSFIDKLKGLCGEGAFGLADDVARVGDYVFSTDTIVENVHFLAGTEPQKIIDKLIRVNVSDLVAKGVQPQVFSLNLAVREEMLDGIILGLREVSQEFDLQLLGGDTTKSDQAVLSCTMFGQAKNFVRRNGARPGDFIYVSGTIGDSYLGLKILQKKLEIENAEYFIKRYEKPEPRVQLIDLVRENASSSIDVSDGLIQDLGHILKESGVGARVNLDMIPVSRRDIEIKELICGGDDYEILFTSARELEGDLICKVGQIVEGEGAKFFSKGDEVEIEVDRGYRHFSVVN